MRAALIGVLLLAFALMLYSRVLSQTEESESAGAEPVASDTGPEAVSPPVSSPSSAGAPDPVGPEGAAPSETAAASPRALISGRGLPGPVTEAYTQGKTIAVLVIKRRGIDDRKVRRAVAPITQRGDAALFTVRAKHIVRYSPITLGAEVSRVPALVVVSPREGSDTPRASVSYGFRGTQSAIQAVRDALYEGGNVPYFPE